MLYAGVASMDITPPVGYLLSGHVARKAKSHRTHDPLRLKALSLRNGRARLAIVTADLIGFSPEFVEKLRAELLAKTGLKKEHLFLAASHTHTGPAMIEHSTTMSSENILSDYISNVRRKIVGGVLEAIDREEPASAFWGQDQADIGAINRRKRTRTVVIMAPNPKGPRDDTVPVLSLRRADGSLLAAVFQATCHPTTISTDISEISADYPGVAQRELEKRYPGCVAMFLNGCSGDVRPAIVKNGKFTGGTFEDIERMGKALANAAANAIELPQKIAKPTLAGALAQVSLPFTKRLIPKNPASLKAFEKELSRKYPQWRPWIKTWAEHCAATLKAGKPFQTQTSTDIQAIRIGDAFLLGLGGEAFVEIGLQLKRRMPKHTLVAGYVGADRGYLPTAAALRTGGYEWVSFIFDKWPAPLDPSVEERLMQSMTKMTRSLAN